MSHEASASPLPEVVAACRGGASVEERVARFAERARRDPHNAFVTLDETTARKEARIRDRGPRVGSLHGLVVSIKDNIAVAGQRMTCGSRMLENYVAPYDATVVERLRASGAVVLGKTNLDEFACGSSGELSAFGPTKNPRDPSRVPGGSSSGAGASVAAEYCDIAIGSDTGGSVRCPASFCGVVGFKPSHGLVSRYGLSDMAMSLESPAPVSGSVAGCAMFLDAVAGPDPNDAVTTPQREDSYLSAIASFPDRLRFGIAPEMLEGVDPEVAGRVRAAAQRLADGRVREIRIPELRHGLASYYLITYSEFASAMQRFDGFRYGNRGPDSELVPSTSNNRAVLGPEVKRRIALGTYATMREYRSKWYTAAVSARRTIHAGFARAFREVDLLLAPTMPFPAFRLGERVRDPLAMYAADVLTVSANLSGIPAGSVPIPGPGLPVGLQVLGPAGFDSRVLQAMKRWEDLS